MKGIADTRACTHTHTHTYRTHAEREGERERMMLKITPSVHPYQF